MQDELRMLSREEYEIWLKSFPENYCAFCDWKKNQIILKEGKHWIWIANRSPYWKYHTIFFTKRHLKEITELSDEEMKEFFEMYSYAISKFRNAKLKRDDGSEIKKYVFFWRLRDDLLDRISGNIRPDHFHVHLTPDKDHFWDSTIDRNAYKIDIVKALGS